MIKLQDTQNKDENLSLLKMYFSSEKRDLNDNF